MPWMIVVVFEKLHLFSMSTGKFKNKCININESLFLIIFKWNKVNLAIIVKITVFHTYKKMCASVISITKMDQASTDKNSNLSQARYCHRQV